MQFTPHNYAHITNVFVKLEDIVTVTLENVPMAAPHKMLDLCAIYKTLLGGVSQTLYA